jgi:hypothetical protein
LKNIPALDKIVKNDPNYSNVEGEDAHQNRINLMDYNKNIYSNVEKD